MIIKNEEKLVAQIPYFRNRLEKIGIRVWKERMSFLLARNSCRKAIRENFKIVALTP